jgi:predicted MFS family arabinose efflux permease
MPRSTSARLPFVAQSLGVSVAHAGLLITIFAVGMIVGTPAMAINLGTAVGSWIAGISLASSLQELGPPLVGTIIAALTLVPLGILVTRSASGAAFSRHDTTTTDRRLR